MEVDKVTNMVVDMEVDKVTNMVADMEVDKVTDMVADLEVNKLTRLAHLLSFASLFQCESIKYCKCSKCS